MKHVRLLVLLAAASGVAALDGCTARQTAVAPAASPTTAVGIGSSPEERVVRYPEGRYELHGDGSARSPFFWVWIPTGAMPPAPPRLPPR